MTVALLLLLWACALTLAALAVVYVYLATHPLDEGAGADLVDLGRYRARRDALERISTRQSIQFSDRGARLEHLTPRSDPFEPASGRLVAASVGAGSSLDPTGTRAHATGPTPAAPVWGAAGRVAPRDTALLTS